MIGEIELRILRTLDRPKSRADLVESLNYTPKTITNALRNLEELDLIDRQRNGTRMIVYPAEKRSLEAFQSLTRSHPHVDFPDLLTSTMLTLLYHLESEEPKTAATLIAESGLPRSTVYRHLRTLTNRAIVTKKRSQYRLSEELAELHTFAYELRHQVHRNRIKNDIGGGTIIWETHDEFLVQTDNSVTNPDYHESGLDAFVEYGLRFLTTSKQYYFYGPKRESLDPADLACHLLLIENDARNRKYTLLLIVATETPMDDVRNRATYYKISETIDPMLEYLQSRGETTSELVPPWHEMKKLASEYEVDL